MKVSGVKGFRDILPPESSVWTALEERAREILRSFNFSEVRLPLLERSELFSHSIGEDTDIVEKEMYTFVDRDETSLTLRPEGTASLVRAYIDGGLASNEVPAKLFYIGPMFRRERPQRGRFRQFHQIGAELIGRDDPMSDAEMIILLGDLLNAVGAKAFAIEINSVGDPQCRPAYRTALKGYAEAHRDELCTNCVKRLARNPFRLLDCKNERCRAALTGAPLIAGYLCGQCERHFDRVQSLLGEAGIAVRVNPRLVRGLDYYTRTAFEVLAEGLGAQNAVGGGGRYDGLIASFGGPAKPAVGFALGMERLLMITGAVERAAPLRPQAVLIALEEGGEGVVLGLARRLRMAGVACELEPSGASLKSRMRRADKLGASFAIIVGAEELSAGKATVRDMKGKKDYRLFLNLNGAGKDLAAQLRGLGHG